MAVDRRVRAETRGFPARRRHKSFISPDTKKSRMDGALRAKSTHESRRIKGGERVEKKKVFVPRTEGGDWLANTLLVIRADRSDPRAPASITVFIKPRRTTKGKDGIECPVYPCVNHSRRKLMPP